MKNRMVNLSPSHVFSVLQPQVVRQQLARQPRSQPAAVVAAVRQRQVQQQVYANTRDVIVHGTGLIQIGNWYLIVSVDRDAKKRGAYIAMNQQAM